MCVRRTATTISRITVTTTTASVRRALCGRTFVLLCRNSPVVLFRQFPGGACLSVKSRSSSRVGLLFVSPTNGRSAKCKTDPAGLVGRKARTPRRIICCRILPRLASPDASKHVATNATTAIKLTTCQTRFLASLAIAGIRLIWQTVGRYSDVVSHSG